MPTQNAIGDNGEAIFSGRITQDSVFKVYFLGEKAPYVDFMLEVLDQVDHSYFCLVQVKSTTLGYSDGGNLRASISDHDLEELIKRPLPTYLAGVDINSEAVYICPAFDINIKYPSIPTKHKLELINKPGSKAELLLLKEDIIKYWNNSGSEIYKTNYQSIL